MFEKWFAGAMASQGTLVAVERASGAVIGRSRYYGIDAAACEVAIDFTFHTRAFWGGVTNAEMKQLMLAHAFQWACSVWFPIGPNNIRSQNAVEKIGRRRSHQGPLDPGSGSVEYVFYPTERPVLSATPT